MFQSTPSRGGRQLAQAEFELARAVSIHALAGRATALVYGID